MERQGVERKLTAILSADVKGYSRLMGEDEEATLATLADYREMMDSLVDLHHGRVVGSAGDSLLADFTSVVDAVQCAVEIQREFLAVQKTLSKAIVFVTHDIREALLLGHRIGVLDHGRLVWLGTPDEFRSSGDPHISALRECLE